MKLDHVAIAVRSIAEAETELCKRLGYSRKTSRILNTRQRVGVMFLKKEGSIDLKLVEPSDELSPLNAFVKRGGGLHHLCFRVDSVSESCDELTKNGARLLATPAPGEAFDDNPIAFCYIGHGLNIELIDTDARRSELESP